MAHTEARSRWLDQGATLWSATIPILLALLPYSYSMFVGIVGLFALGLWQTYFYPGALGALLHRRGFTLLALLLITSASFAVFPGEAYLQLTHFIPFFWFWAVAALYLQQATQPWRQIYHWALALVLATIPLNLVGIVEYALKHLYPAAALTTFPLIDWLYIGDLDNPRSFALFDDPNALASFLVMVLGLNIGLLFLRPRESAVGQLPPWGRVAVGGNLLLTLMCLFCSGSRNGYLTAALLLLVSFFVVRTGRWVRSLGGLGLVLIVVTTLRFGIGGRALSWAWLTEDPRVHVWGLALQLIRDRPILGHGLGSYKLLYNGEVPGYDYIAHAHNFWLMIAAEAGLPTLLLFTLIVGGICYRSCRSLGRLSKFPNHYAILLSYQLSFLGIALFSLFDITLAEARVNLLAWLSLAVMDAAPVLSRLRDTEG